MRRSAFARRAVVGVALGTQLAAAQLARAQPAPATRDAASPSAAAVDPQKLEEAKRHFQLGLSLLRDPEGERVEAAYLEFKIAYDLSHSPRVLGNVGYCAMKLERNSEAVASYREYVAKVPNIDPVERAQIDQDLQMMTEGAATMTVRFQGPGEWTLVDERVPVRGATITNTYGPSHGELTLLIHPGHHVVRLRTGSDDQGTWEFDSTSGTTDDHTFAPAPPHPAGPALPPAGAPPIAAEPVKPPPSRTPAWILVGAGGAMLAAGAVTGVLALGKMRDLETTCPNDVCPDGSYHATVTAGRTLGTATDALVIGGGALVAGGALWLFMLRGNAHESGAARAPAVGAACLPGACNLTMRGAF